LSESEVIVGVIRLKQRNGAYVIGPSGSIDMDEAEAILLAIRNLSLGGTKTFVVDLESIVSPDYRGLSHLVRGLKGLSNGNSLFSFSGLNQYSKNLLSLIDPNGDHALVGSEDKSQAHESWKPVRKQAC
jgi:anti-anti-sigma regulatory factor